MATITGFTAARMLEIENAAIVDASIVDGDLILERHDSGTVNAGSVIGPTGPAGGNADVGDIKASMRSSLTGWLLMGQTITNANVSYPTLWALTELNPWKSGTTLTLPGGEFVLQGGGTLSSTTGANTKAIIEANLPPHVHTQIAHTHITDVHTHAPGAHTHSINHDHASTPSGTQSANHTHSFSDTTSSSGAHIHNPSSGDGFFAYSAGGAAGDTDSIINSSGTNDTRGAPSTSSDGAHTHAVSGTTGNNSASHTHAIDIPLFTGTSGAASASNTGSGGGGNTSSSGGGDTGSGLGTSAPFDVQQLALRVNFFIKY